MSMNIEWAWIENAEGKPDTMLTFSIVAMTVVIIKVLLGGINFHIGGQVYAMLPIDAGTIGALLTPTLSAYVARRYTDKKFEADDAVPAANQQPAQNAQVLNG